MRRGFCTMRLTRRTMMQGYLPFHLSLADRTFVVWLLGFRLEQPIGQFHDVSDGPYELISSWETLVKEA